MSSVSLTVEKPVTLPPSKQDGLARISENGLEVLRRRYLRKGLDGKPAETAQEMFWRVASNVALPERAYGSEAEYQAVAEQFYDLLTELRFFPNSPTFTGAGTPLGQLAACFVLAIDDDMGKDSAEGIFNTLRNAALIQQTGGGNGFSFSRLRPKSDPVNSSAGVASGPVGFLRVYDAAFGEIAQGGCLTPDSLVFTSNGLLRLDELVDESQAGWQEHSLSVPTDEGDRPSPRGYNNGVQPVLTVATREGLTLTGTLNHKVKIMTSEGPAWRRLDELQAGDAILVKLGQHQGRLRALRRPAKTHGNQAKIDLPSVLDELLAFLLGYLAGDGFVAADAQDHRVGFSVAHDSYLLQELPTLLQQAFPGCNVHRQQKAGDASVTFVIDSALIKRFLVDNGFAKAKSHEVQVPRLVRQSPANIVGAYLRGLFEADGGLSHGYPQLNTTSKLLAHEVAALLIGLGCPVTLRTTSYAGKLGKRPQYILRINSSTGLEAWRARIGCDQRSRFVICYTFRPDAERESSYALPHPRYWLQPVLDEITLPQIDRQGRGQGVNWRATDPGLRRKLLRYLRSDRQLTLSAYQELSTASPEFAQHARSVDSLWFVHVSETRPAGESLTLDLEVEGNHTYLANGLVTHNTRRGANMGVLRVDHPDIEEFISCKAKEGAIANFNISVGVTDAFMQAVHDNSDFNLVNPHTRKVSRTVRARDLFDKIIHYAHRNGEPGVLFLDAANRSNPVPHMYELEATNPCVTGDTLVATPEGWRRADSIRVGDEICTVLGTGHVHTVEVNENTPIYEVHLSDGAIVRATASHQFHARDARTKFFEPRRVDQLRPGDWVRVHRSTTPNNPVPGRPSHLTDREYGFLVGVLVGDGTYTPHALSKNVVRISTHADEHEWNQFLTVAFSKVGVEKMYTYVNHGSRSMMMDPKPGRVIADWVKSMPLEPARGPEKRLPDEYINSNREFLTGLLDGLFSTDGSVDLQSNHPLVRFHTSSLELAQQVRRILLMFGIHGRVCTSVRKRHDIDGRLIRNDRPKHDVVISGMSFGRFFEQIRLSHPQKQSRLEDAALRSNFTGGNWAAKVIGIVPAGLATVYDLYEPKSDTWITEGYVSRGCGEQFLGPYENCCLGSINLAQHVTEDGHIDWGALERTTVESTRFLDDVVSANKYVPAVPQLQDAAHRVRRIGLGVMGLADVMYKIGVRYGDQESLDLASQVMEFVRYHCMRTSIELARERGPFPAIGGSIYDPENLLWQPPTPLQPYSHSFARPEIDWDVIVDGIKAHGIRNGAQSTIAPTGTIGTVTGCEGYGCEPVFALAYTRYVKEAGGDVTLTYVSPLFLKALDQAGVTGERRERLVEQIVLTGTCQGIDELPKDLQHTFVVSQDITPTEHVLMQAVLQRYVDNSISKTCNFPPEATPRDVAQAYVQAWELGCKGLTVYVTGSRQEVVLETKATADAKKAGAADPTPNGKASAHETLHAVAHQVEGPDLNGNGVHHAVDYDVKRPRPRRLHGATYRRLTPLGTAYVTVNDTDEGEPFEVFMNVGKAGSDVAAVSEALGRLISLTLRMPSSLTPTERLQQVVYQLNGIGGGRHLGFGPQRVRSLPDAIAQVLTEHLEQTPAPQPMAAPPVPAEQLALPIPKQIGDLCPDCGNSTLLNVEGCVKCHVCGYSEC
jgi:ribonucleotide reductase alpha subunit